LIKNQDKIFVVYILTILYSITF